MSKLGQLQGSPWHVEKFSRKPGDKRRHRSRCINYNRSKEFCSVQIGRCVGAAHCRYYAEDGLPKNVSRIPTIDSEPKEQQEQKQEETNYYNIPVGSRIQHKKYGTVTLIKLSNGIATVLFDNGDEHRLQLEVCAKNNLVFLLEDKY